MALYAHSLPGHGPERWQLLEDHLRGVAERAGAAAARFGAREWGMLAGWWHDLGKVGTGFQEMLLDANDPDFEQPDIRGRIDHSTAGAQHAVRTLKLFGHVLAYAIAGHHSGLLDAYGEGASQANRLRKDLAGREDWSRAPAHLLEAPAVLSGFRAAGDMFSVAFFTRMLFSCLVDADFLDTEAFMSADRSMLRPQYPEDVLARMERAVDARAALFGEPRSLVDRTRLAVREASLSAASLDPGLFRLTVPTGGGKTLASLAFALRHARTHGLDRVIYVVPFTSIVDQIVDSFRRDVFGPLEAELGSLVLEHHSNVDLDLETDTARLATENWDSPLIVTTAVQFYESLFASRPSRCRKLHRMARSVIVLDEAQTLPVNLLKPCLAAIRELSENYGSSLVLCTATQPALQRRDGFDFGLDDVREIVPDPGALFAQLRRVVVEDLGELSDDQLVRRLMDEPRVLCIVNTRLHARRLFDRLEKDGANIHLSALMCPAHRSVKLDEIRRRLTEGLPCRVISTQLIEAGVDVDFPVVFRSMAGLDSIAQAAGRCNRNGRLPAPGRTYVFRSEDRGSERYFRDTSAIARQILEAGLDPLGLEAVERYFRQYYWERQSQWDKEGILDLFGADRDPDLPLRFNFATAARKFHLIDETQKPVIVPWGKDGWRLCEELRADLAWKPKAQRSLLRRLQRYTVQVPAWHWEAGKNRRFEILQDRFSVLTSIELHYSDETGLLLDDERRDGLFM